MPKNIKKQIRKHKNFAYTQRDFESLREELVRHARHHYGDKIIDFSDASLAGLFTDMAAYVGDSLTFYLDHQYNELFLETAIETENLQRLIRQSGLKIRGPSPSVVDVNITLRIPSKTISGQSIPDTVLCPTIKNGSVFSSVTGINFTLLDDIDFSETNSAGELIGDYVIGNVDSSGVINDFLVTRVAPCSSDEIHTETFSIGTNLVPFRKIQLSKSNVTEVITVKDSSLDPYYEVDSLTQDIVYRRFDNSRADDLEAVPQRLELIPAPKRFTVTRNASTGKSTLRFGSGDEEKFDEDIIPDPSLHALTLYGDRKTFSKVSIDPNDFLGSNTLGVAPRNTTLTITYRHGGGLKHNTSAGSITSVKTLITNFGSGVPTANVTDIRASISITNPVAALGGENEPTLEELRTAAILGKNSQSRVVSREDLIARVYNMPTNFGRVFRVSVRDNPSNPLAAQLHIISRNKEGKLVLSSDTLKENLVVFLSKFRLISDAIDVLDAKIVNIGVEYAITTDRTYNSEIVVQAVNNNLKQYFKIENFQIDQPIILGEIENLILNTAGVMGILSLNFTNNVDTIDGRVYSSEIFSTSRQIDRGILFPPRGGIIEIRYPNDDIVGRVS